MATSLLLVTLTLTLVTSTLAQDLIQPPSVIMTEPEVVLKSRLSLAFNFVCRATGFPLPVISWFKDDVKIATMDTSADIHYTQAGNLNFRTMSFTTVGKYQCKAENLYGISQSNLTEIQLAIFSDFPETPAVVSPTEVNEGDPLQLKCEYTDPFSHPVPLWSWVRQDTLDSANSNPTQIQLDLDGRLSVDPRGRLYFQHVLSSDNIDNWYHLCQAWNPVMNVKKIGSPHQLNIKPVANIQEMPAKLVYNNGPNVEVIAGENIELYCIFEGYPTVQVRWEKLKTTSAEPQPFFNYENGKTKLVLQQSENNNKFEGKYRCQGFQVDKPNEPLAATTFNVSVLEKPRFVSGPHNVNITDGKNVQFICNVIAEPPAQITWFVNGIESNVLPFDGRREIVGNKYSFKNLRRGTSAADSDLQVVTCMAQNLRADGSVIGQSYLDGYVNVVAVMAFNMKPQNINITEDTEKVVLDCEVVADTGITPRVSWHYEQVPITLTEGKIEQAPNNSLIFFPPQFDDIDAVLGEYMCVAETFAPMERITTTVLVSMEGGTTAKVAAASISLWWIGLVLALLILILIILLIFCCLKRHGGGQTHDVDKVEREMGNDPIKDLQSNGFKDYLPREKAPIEGNRERELEDFSLDAMDNEGYNEDNDSLEQYATEAYPGEYGTNPGRHNPAYQPNHADTSYGDPGYGGPGYGGPGYPASRGNPAFVSDEAEV